MVTRQRASLAFEMGPSRPPSEAQSLLLRIVRGCPWHRCEFCSSHRTRKLQIRRVQEITRDIDTVKAIADAIKQMSLKSGYGADVRQIAAAVYERPPNDSFRIVALWLFFGGENVFFQDADALIMRTPQLVEVLKYLKKTLPSVSRVTCYGRSKTAAMKSLDELKELHEAGLSRLHVGLESGSDEVLSYVCKGVTAAEHIDGGRKVVESGISICEYVMPGLGGRRWKEEHPRETARVLNEINPGFIRLRSLAIREDIPLYQKYASGDFQLLSDDEVVKEIRELIERLEVTSYLASDHIENLLQEVEGQLPQDKEKMLGHIDRYLAMSDEDRLFFRLGRRMGYYSDLEDFSTRLYKREKIAQIISGMRSKGEDIEEAILDLKKRFLV